MSDEYVLASDDDGHWYVIPADKEQAWYEYLVAVYRFWEDDLVDPQGLEPEEPDWCDHVGGAPGLVKFKSYRIE